MTLRGYTAYTCPKTPEIWRALTSSFGARAAPASSFLDRETAAIVGGLEYGSDTLLREIRTTGHPYLFVDGGYLKARRDGERVYYRIVPNAYLQHWLNAERAADSRRLGDLGVSISDWKSAGGPILVCISAAKHHWFFGLENWLSWTITELKLLTDRPIVVRSYEAAQAGQQPPLAEALRDAWAVVTHTSTAAVEAALAGVPVFVAPENPAAPVGNSDLAMIETPLRPERAGWAASLAWGQFTLEEIANGTARAVTRETEACRPFLPSNTPGWRESRLRQPLPGLP